MAKHGNIHIGDKEVVLEVISQSSNKPEMMSFPWNEVLNIRVVNGFDRKFLFFKKEFDHIIINTSNPETPLFKMPIIIDKAKAKEKFDEYIDAFAKFSKVRAFKFEDRREK